jgi:restriction system protein
VKWEMAEGSLFAVLLRSSWWISAGIAAAVITVALMALPDAYKVVGAFGALPFVVIAAIAAWRAWQRPSGARVAGTLEAVRAMAWPEFAKALEAAWRRDGYEVRPLAGFAADFELKKAGRRTLVSAKRWKAARTGVEPLRELLAARDAEEPQACVYVAAVDLSDNARQFAADQRIALVAGPELALLLPGIAAGKGKRSAA